MTSDNNLLKAASQLAYFILRDKEAAESSTAAAISRLNVVATAQSRRYYYVPGVTAKAYGVRTKVTLGDSHLLQRLIYDETEPYERDQERNGLFDEERLLTHFIKHLVWATVKRNSFYVTLGVSRLLYRYTNLEAMDLHALILQNPSRIKEYDYWRSRKGQLMKEIKDRFGDLIAVTRRAHNEERFVAYDDSSRFAPHVKECLKTLMPWGTNCPLPADAAAVSGSIPSLEFNGDDPDAEHQIEISRMHAILHSDCFARLVAGLNLDPPDSRLEVPQFFCPTNHDHGDPIQGEETKNKTMTSPDLNIIQAKLMEHERLLQRSKPQRLHLLAGRRQCGIMDLHAGSQANFRLDKDDDFIELRASAEEGGFSVALYPIDFTRLKEAGNVDEFTLALADGRKLAFFITPQRDENDELIGAMVNVNYQASPWQSWKEHLSSLFAASIPSFPYALAAALILTSMIAGLAFWRMTRFDSPENAIAVNKPSGDQPTDSGTMPVHTPEQLASPGAKPVASGKQAQSTGSRPSTINPDAIRDPDVHSITAIKTLAEVSQIFIEITGNPASAKALSDQLTLQFKASGRWEPALKEDTNAALNVIIKPDGHTFHFQMVNAKGAIIWPLKAKWKTYSGEAEEVAKQLVHDLLKAAQ